MKTFIFCTDSTVVVPHTHAFRIMPDDIAYTQFILDVDEIYNDFIVPIGFNHVIGNLWFYSPPEHVAESYAFQHGSMLLYQAGVNFSETLDEFINCF